MRQAIATLCVAGATTLACCGSVPTEVDAAGSSTRASTATSEPSTSTSVTDPDSSGVATANDTTASTPATSSTSASTESTGVPDTTGAPEPLSFTVVTFNTGTTTTLAHAIDGDDYGSDEADLSDQHYGDGLAWQTNIDLTAAFFAQLQPDIVAFQEIFYSGDCPSIPPEAYPGFVCETWQPGDPTVAQTVLGPGYQIACNLGRPDKCVGVRQEFGSIVGCNEDLCLDGLDGVPIPDCGGGSRNGRGVIELADGRVLTLVSVHGTSGFLPEDWACRQAQVDQVFVDFGGTPAADGRRNLVLGDLNTDPYRAVVD
ncbi:MAG: hypothetical protein K0V04_04995, partial [Deltaproteobacteria bacterium]|nr:hypothetical protein [Deltaproteobacteria bacterium]